MALDDLLISTGVDNLIKLVHERGRVELKAAAAELHLPIQTVEDWTHVLEAEGIIKIQYQLTSVYLVWASMSPQEYTKTSKAVEAKKSQTVQKLETLNQTVDQNLGDLNRLKSEYTQMQQKTRNEMERLGGDKTEAERLGAEIEQVVAGKREKLLSLKEELEGFHGQLEQFDLLFKKKAAGGKEGGPDLGAQMEALAKSESRLNERIQSFVNQFDSLQTQIGTMQSQLGNDQSGRQLADVKTSLDDLKFARAEMSKTLSTLQDDMKSLGSEINGLVAQIDAVENRKSAAANPKKLALALEAIAKQTTRDRENMLGELNKNLEVVRKQMQAYSQAQYQYQNIKSRLENLQAQYGKESEELEQFLEALDEAQKRYSQDLDAAKAGLGGTQKDYGRLLEQAKQVESVLSQIDSLKMEGENLSTKLKGVLREAEVVAMAAPAGSGSGASGGGSSGSSSGASGSGAGASSGAGSGSTGAGDYGGAGGGMTRGRVGKSAPMGGGAVAGIGSERSENIPPELAQKIALTTAEEEQFEKKRNELRGLIRKMWDEDRKPSNA